ncbi:U3 small nucleolar RNA-associated protein 13 [Strigomonas culicis]|uniref:U3 small nucleolar RNA-associated protein 13 n=1 Tax=Strigomonas culicis TaxID=28005 RepID=S9TUY1_9TRYP|nr:U3 small nucleolar RNA-associated protein 13 [Strigomonas culicis]EPY22954.1 U3 small nucleolar RNA-associated protein 13 [Strigomonas culicis]|eukprot:EPY20369.1 U3 small nucleolar RNA-associated protein 13 [Strigomonas culicis]
MEGKNCFRTRWEQRPIYSGGNIATIALPRTPADPSGTAPLSPTDYEECLVTICGDTVNVLRTETGKTLCSFTVPLDDVILCLDTVSVLSPAAPPGEPATRKTVAKRREKDAPNDPAEPAAPGADSHVPVGSYVAVGTRQLQIFLLRVDLLAPPALPESPAKADEQAEEGEVPATPQAQQERRYEMQQVVSWTAAQQAISTLHFSPSGLYLVVGSTDGGVKVWNAFHHHLTHNFNSPFTSVVHTLFLDAQEAYLIVGSFEGHVAVFDFVEKVLLCHTRSHVQAVEAVALSEDGSCMFTIARDRRLSILSFDAKAQRLEERRAIVVKEHVSSAVFERTHTLHVGSMDGIVASYGVSETEAAQLQHRLPKPPAADLMDNVEESFVRSLIVRGKPKGVFDSAHSFFVDAGRSDAGLYAADAGFNIARIEPEANTKAHRVVSTIVSFFDQVLDVKTFADSFPYKYMVVNNSKDVRLYDHTGCCLSSRVLQGHTDTVLTCAVSPDAAMVATAGKDQVVRFWDTQSWSCVAKGVRGHTAEITSISFNMKPSDTYFLLFSVGADENLRLWDAAQARQAAAPEQELTHRDGIASAHSGPVYALAVAPNDQYVATGGKDKSVNVWSVTGKKLYREASLKGHRRGISALTFSSADRVLASASNDGTVRLWSLVSRTCVKTLQVNKTALLQVSFFNHGTQIVTGDAEGVLRVWAVNTSESVWSAELHEEKIWVLSVLERDDETVFLSGSAAGVLIASEDYTAEEARRVREVRDDTILKEQELANAMRKSEFARAFLLALRLNHPRHLRQVLVQWCSKDAAACEAQLKDELLRSLDGEQLQRLLQFTREWMTNSRHCHVANLVTFCFLSCFHYKEVLALPYVRGLIEPLLSYAMRHTQRQYNLLHMTYYMDYVTRSLTPEALSVLPPYDCFKRARETIGEEEGADAVVKKVQ